MRISKSVLDDELLSNATRRERGIVLFDGDATYFGGMVEFNPVPLDTYYLFNISSTPKGFSIWDMKIDVNSAETSVTLDQNNAVATL